MAGATIRRWTGRDGGGNNLWIPALITGDVDATAFLGVTGITDPTIVDPLTHLCIDLKSESLWSTLQAFYPLVGASAFTHKFNLMDPRDLNAAFRLSFNGGWTHSATGALPDGSTAWADTHWSPAVNGNPADIAFGFYCRTDVIGPGNAYDMGCSNSSDQQATICISRYNNGMSYFTVGSLSYAANVANPDGRGHFVTSRFDASDTHGFRNGSAVVSAADSVSLGTDTMYLGANNHGGTPTYFSTKEHAGDHIGHGLTAMQTSSLYDIIQAFETSLARAV